MNNQIPTYRQLIGFHDPNIKYTLTVQQQPEKARLCSFKDKVDRRPLDPPPIVQLHQVNNLSFNDYQISANFFLHATLVDSNDFSDLNYVNGNSTIAGSVVQSLHKLKDTNNTEGAFFIFSDLSIRIEGVFRLKFTLFQIKGLQVESVCSVFSDPFRVYSPKSFPGMSESTELTKYFSDQGVRIRVRKEARPVASPSMKRKRGSESQLNQSFESSTSSSPKEDDKSYVSGSHVMSMQNLLITESPPLPPIFSSDFFPSRILLPPPHPTIEPPITPSTSRTNYYHPTQEHQPNIQLPGFRSYSEPNNSNQSEE